MIRHHQGWDQFPHLPGSYSKHGGDIVIRSPVHNETSHFTNVDGVRFLKTGVDQLVKLKYCGNYFISCRLKTYML